MGQEENEKKTKKEKKDEEVRLQLSPTGGDRLAGPRPQRDIKWHIFLKWLIMSFYTGTRDTVAKPDQSFAICGHKFLCSRQAWPWRYVTRRMRVVLSDQTGGAGLLKSGPSPDFIFQHGRGGMATEYLVLIVNAFLRQPGHFFISFHFNCNLQHPPSRFTRFSFAQLEVEWRRVRN